MLKLQTCGSFQQPGDPRELEGGEAESKTTVSFIIVIIWLKKNGFIVHVVFYVLLCLERDSMSHNCMSSLTTMNAVQNKMGQFS